MGCSQASTFQNLIEQTNYQFRMIVFFIYKLLFFQNIYIDQNLNPSPTMMIKLPILLVLIMQVIANNVTFTVSIGHQINYKIFGLDSACSYEYDWAISVYGNLQFIALIPININFKQVKIYRNKTIFKNVTLNESNLRLIGHITNTQLNSWYYGVDPNSYYFRIYHFDNLTRTYASSFTISDITFTSKNTQVVYIINTTRALYKFNATTNQVVQTLNLTTKYPQIVKFYQNYLIVYSTDVSNASKAYFSFYFQNLTLQNEFQVIATPYTETPMPVYNNIKIRNNHTYILQGEWLIRSYGKTVEVWNITTRSLEKKISYGSQVVGALRCLQYLVVAFKGRFQFYEMGSWVLLNSYSYTFVISVNMKCFQNQKTFSFFSPDTDANVKYLKLNSIVTIPPASNTTNNTNNTTNNTINNTNITTNNTINTTNTTNNLTTNSINVTINTTNATNVTTNNTINNTTANTAVSSTTNNNTMDATTGASANNSTPNTSSNTNTSYTNTISNITSNSTPDNTNTTNTTNTNNNTFIPQTQLEKEALDSINRMGAQSDPSLNMTLSHMMQIMLEKIEQLKGPAQAVTKATGVLSTINVAAKFVRPLSGLFQELWFYGYHSKVYPDIVQLLSQQMDVLCEYKIKPFLTSFYFPIEFTQAENVLYKQVSPFLPDRAPQTIYFIQVLNQLFFIGFALGTINFIMFHILDYVTNRISMLQSLNNYFAIRCAWWNLLVILIAFNIRPLAFYSFAQLSVSSSFCFFDKINLIVTLTILSFVLFYTFAFYPLIFKFEKQDVSQEILQISHFTMKSFLMEMSVNCIRGFFQAFVHGSYANRHQFQIVGLLLVDSLILIISNKFRPYFRNIFTFALTLVYFIIYLVFDIFIALYTFQTLQNFNYELIFLILILSLSGVAVIKIFYFILVVFYNVFKWIKARGKVFDEPKDKKNEQSKKKCDKMKNKYDSNFIESHDISSNDNCRPVSKHLKLKFKKAQLADNKTTKIIKIKKNNLNILSFNKKKQTGSHNQKTTKHILQVKFTKQKTQKIIESNFIQQKII